MSGRDVMIEASGAERTRDCDGDTDIAFAARSWGGDGLGRYLFPGLWLVYLAQPISGVSEHSTGSAAVVGYLLVVAFAADYLVALQLGFGEHKRLFWTLYASAVGLTAAVCFFAGQNALVLLVYVGVLTVAAPTRHRLAMVGVLTIAAAGLPTVVPGWSGSIDWGDAMVVLLVALAMWGFFRIIAQNAALTAARAEVARLAAENERSRIARDLHDLLGHSLTTITVKAGLARRLAESGDNDRARAEIAAVEQLSRRTLGDVRAAVSAHREVTLAGELATAGEVLRAAGVLAELPPSVAEADPTLVELFGWVVREGVTNVVRHAHATHVWITLEPQGITITDDGRGSSTARMGNGLLGLTERAEAAQAQLQFTSGISGSRLSVARRQPVDASPGDPRPTELATH